MTYKLQCTSFYRWPFSMYDHCYADNLSKNVME